MSKDDAVPPPHEYWIDKPEGLPFMAWLAINQARQLRAYLGEDEFWQWVREELPGHNFARWWRKYGAYILME